MPSSLVSRTRIETSDPILSRTLDIDALLSSSFTTVRNDVRLLRTEPTSPRERSPHALGVSRQTINAIETGRYLPSLPLAFGLARFFETTVEQIFHPDTEEIPT